MNSNLVYQTIQLNCDKEYSAEPLDFTGIRTIKLTNKPTDIEVWISAENTGANLFPLINRGDGWVNIEEPLQNVYIYTKGTTISGEQLILNVTGQKDIFNYGNNSSERIDKVGLIEGFSPQAQMQLQNAIFNLWNPPKIIETISIQGEIRLVVSRGFVKKKLIVLPMGNRTIKSLNLDDNKYYKLEFFGHIDNGSAADDLEAGGMNRFSQTATHLALFNNTNNAKFTLDTSVDIDECYAYDKTPWKSEKTDLFDIFGLKYNYFYNIPEKLTSVFEDKGLNFLNPAIFKGSIINKYEYLGLAVNIGAGYGGSESPSTDSSAYMHSSLLINLYEMQDPTQFAV